MTREEEIEHRGLMIYLLHQHLIRREYDNTISVTEKGLKRIAETFKENNIFDVALLLIHFCNEENIKYFFDEGVKK